MVRILGNSSERVPIPDLKDVIYYRQIKEYTDQEYEISRDLKKELAKGRITLLGRSEPLRGSATGSGDIGAGVKSADLRSALREILPELQGSPNLDARDVAREMAPIVADLVRQEMSRMSQGFSPIMKVESKTSTFVGPEYVPTISSEGMTSNIEAKKKTVSDGAATDALAALRKMRQ